MSEALAKLRTRVNEQAHKYLLRSGVDWQGAVTRRFGHGPITGRSGILQGSIQTTLTGTTIADFQLRCFSKGARYARAQERGAVIRPVKGKRLAIPGPGNLMASGVARFPSARDFINAHKGEISIIPIKHRPGTAMVIWTPGKTQGKKKAGRGYHMFTLVPKVTLPGPSTTGTPSRLGFFDTWHEQAPKRNARFRKMLGAEAIFAGKT